MTKKTRMRDNKEDKGRQQGHRTRMGEKDVKDEGQRTTRRDEYKGNKDEDEDNKDKED